MNNIQFNTNNLVQNSAEYKLILSRFASQLYDLSRYNQPVLILATLVVLLVFTLIVYYFDARKLKKAQNQVETKETADKVEPTVNTNNISESKQEEKTNNLESNENLILNLNSIRDEIIELRKELEVLQYNKISTDDDDDEDDDEEQEAAEDEEDILKANDSKSESDSDSKSPDNENKNSTESNIQKLISNMTTSEIEGVLQTCSNYILIPNWYTKEDFEDLSNTNISKRTWKKLLTDGEEYSSLIDETNAMMVGWYENSVSPKIDKVPYNISSIEDSEQDSDYEDSSDSEESEDEETKLLENDDSDEEDSDEEESEEEDSDEENKNEEPTDKKPNIFIINQLEKLKYSQLKKIAGVSNNKLNKKELIELITKDYKKYSILNALSMFV
jgi:hypothetical protein